MTGGRAPEMEGESSLLVVGGGVAGAAVALAARELGAEVAVVEPGRAGARATGASAGMLAVQYEAEHPTPLFRLGLRAREMQPEFLDRIESLSGTSLDRRTGGMLVPHWEPHEERRSREQAEWQRGEGLRAEVLDPDAAAELQPGLSPDAISFLWLPDEAQLDTQRLAGALPAALGGAGVRILQARAEELVVRGGAVEGVRVERRGRRETVAADRVVLAAGAWSGRLEGLPRPLPVRPARGQMLRYPAGHLRLRRLVATRGGRYLVPRGDGTVLAGSTMEAAGFDATPTPAGTRAIRLAAERLAPALAGVEPVERWAGLRPDTPDERPVIGPDPEVAGLFYATGYGRNGILVAPAAGRAVAELALEGSTEMEWRPFRPGRFGEA